MIITNYFKNSNLTEWQRFSADKIRDDCKLWDGKLSVKSLAIVCDYLSPILGVKVVSLNEDQDDFIVYEFVKEHMCELFLFNGHYYLTQGYDIKRWCNQCLNK